MGDIILQPRGFFIMQASLYDEIIKVYDFLCQTHDVLIDPRYAPQTNYNLNGYTINKKFWVSYDYNVTQQLWSTSGIAFPHLRYNRYIPFLTTVECAVVYACKSFGAVDPIGTLNDLSVSAKAYFMQEINKKLDGKNPNFGKYFAAIDTIFQHKCESIYVN